MEISGGIHASLSGRYALALFELARDERQIDAVSESLRALRQALVESGEFRQLAASPLLSRAETEKGVAAVAAEMGLDSITTRFLGVLARNRRLGQLGAVIRAYTMLAAQHRGETTAEVTSAHPLTDEQIEALKAKLRQQTHKEIAIETYVDPAILGGLVVKLGSRQIDASIRTKLNTLANAMKG